MAEARYKDEAGMTAGWCSRTLSAAVFAVICVLLAALVHVVIRGDAVP
jgi:hypothetical protein